MKSKKHAKHKKQKHGKHRNNGAGGAAAAPSRNRPRLRVPRRGTPPPWKTIGAAVAGSVGSAAVSALLVNQKIVKPDTAALLMAATGGLGAYLTDGDARVAFTGVAAAGAGQYALVKIGGLAEKRAQQHADEKAKADAEAKQLPAASAPPEPPRQQARGRGVVVDLFRDTAADLELLDDDEDRYSTRDADPDDDDTPIEIDLDEAA